MSSEVQLYGQGRNLRPQDRKALSRYSAESQVRIGATDAETDVVIARVDSLTATVGAGMAAVTRVAQLQQQLEFLAPQASARLNALADMHAMSLLNIVTRHERTLGRM